MANEFLVSVANAILRDPTTGNAIAYGKTNITSAFTLSTAQTDVRGGIGNPLLYTYIHDRNLEVKIEQATFDSAILALNAGQSVLNSTVNVTQTDCITLTSGSGTLSQTPVGDVTVLLENGTFTTVTPSTTSIYVPGGANQKVTAIYITAKAADELTIETLTPPTVVDLTLIAEVRSNAGVITEYLQINVPRFQVSGNYTLSLSANGVSNQALDGKALAVESTDCASNEYYAKIRWIPAGSASVALSSLAAIPSIVTFSATAVATVVGTQQLSVLGIRGGIYQNQNVTSECSFAKSGSGGAAISVNSAGLITCASAATAGQTALVTVTHTPTSLTDVVNVVVSS